MHEECCFLTLTYDDAHCPEDGSLRQRDLQLFLKRARKRLGVKLRYFACGEYGENFGRPHFHVCLFGFDFVFDRVLFKKSGGGFDIYTSALLSSIWTDGFASVGELSFESAAYVARYVCKKVTGDQAKTHYAKLSLATGEIYEAVPEFARMSLKPGIGSDWYDKYWSDVFPRDFVVMNGMKVKPPRYYDGKFAAQDEEAFTLMGQKRLERAMACVDDCTPRRLAVRARVFDARLSFKKREL